MKSPTPEQSLILACAKSPDSLFISACAGGGKTSTLKAFSQALKVAPTLALAFNKSSQLDLEAALPGHIKCQTFNALGHSVLRRSFPNVKFKISFSKQKTLISSHISSNPDLRPHWKALGQITKTLVQHLHVPDPQATIFGGGPEAQSPFAKPLTFPEAKALAESLGFDYPPELHQAVTSILSNRIQTALEGHIDFADQIYIPLIHPQAAILWPKFPTILIDEAQDLSPANQLMIKSISPKRVIACGDPHQSIYAFRGADELSIPNLIQTWNLQPYSLTHTFRCAKAIVAHINSTQPDIPIHPHSSNPKGRTSSPSQWNLSLIPQDASCAILCRNNFPLFALASQFLLANRPFQMASSVFIFSLKSTIKSLDLSLTPSIAIARWLAERSAWARNHSQPQLISRFTDQAQTLQVIFHHSQARTQAQAIKYLESLIDQKSGPILSTGHKAKGLEWDHVFHLNPNLIPSKYALRAEEAGNPQQLKQEENLLYVINSRAKQSLTFIHLNGLELDSSTRQLLAGLEN